MKRRKLLIGAAGLGAGGLTMWLSRRRILKGIVTRFDNTQYELSEPSRIGDSGCTPTQLGQEGPYYLPPPTRSDIREGKEGKELQLQLQVVQVDGCMPVADALVEVWQADAAGVYSAYPEHLARDIYETLKFVGFEGAHAEPTREGTYLRGAQQTGPDGMVRFTTIFPGWYDLRAPHIHFKVTVAQKQLIIGQFYFPHELSNTIYRTIEPYIAGGETSYRPENDLVIDIDKGARASLLKPEFVADQPLRVSAKIACAMS